MLSEAPEGPLHGVPIAVKDMFALPWRAPRDGCVRNLFGVGARRVHGLPAAARRRRGDRRRHEHARVRRRVDRPHLRLRALRARPGTRRAARGGSSGGSASAVGARLVAGAVGTDGGGSIRYPAAYCGVTGLKFTWGSVPPDGYTHGFASMGAPGPMCRDAADARLLGGALLGRPLASRRANGLRLGDRAVRSGTTSTPRSRAPAGRRSTRSPTAGLESREVELEGRRARRRSRPCSAWRSRACRRPSPSSSAEVEPQLSPVGRALVEVQPAAARPPRSCAPTGCARSCAVRSRRAFEDVDVLAWPTVPAPPPPIEDPTVELPSGRVPGRLRQRAAGRDRATSPACRRSRSRAASPRPGSRSACSCSRHGARTSGCSTSPSCWSRRPSAGTWTPCRRSPQQAAGLTQPPQLRRQSTCSGR